MHFSKWLKELSIEGKGLYYKLTIIFAFFFMTPVIGFLYYALKYGLMKDEHTPFFLLALLCSTFFGFTMLRRLFDQVTAISKAIGSKQTRGASQSTFDSSGSTELNSIVSSFNNMAEQFEQTNAQLQNRMSEILILKELSELCYVTFDPEEILYVTLERALALTDSNVGAIMLLEDSEPKTFVVTASIGHGEYATIGKQFAFDDSIAKYAVINKSALIVEDIEQDSRFGRANRDQYGTKSFICMPIKTSRNVVGVMTISQKDDSKIYTQKEVEVLTPLLSNAAFTFENLRLLRENEQISQFFKSLDKFYNIVNSSLRGEELVNTALNEVQEIIPFQMAALMLIDPNTPYHITVSDVVCNLPTDLVKNASYNYQNSIIEKAIKQQVTVLFDAPKNFLTETDQSIFSAFSGKSCLLSPLRIESKTKGVLVLVADKESLQDAQKLIYWITNGLSLAIERSTLLDEVNKQHQELETIKHIGRVLASSTFDMNKVLAYTVDMTNEIMQAEAGSLLLLKKDKLEFAVAFNLDINLLQQFHIELGQGIAGNAASRGETIIENNVRQSPYFSQEIDEKKGLETRSALCVPLIVKGKVIGVIEVLNKIDGDFNVNDKHLLQSIASSVSIAMENAHLYEETLSMAENERNIRQMFQKFVPKEIVDKITGGLETGKEIINELKTVTLLNIDIRGYSNLSSELGPQKTVLLLNNFFSSMGEIVFEHNGIVDKYLGDGFLAIFGAPVSGAADADNAVAAAVKMREELKQLNLYLTKEVGISLKVGISIFTGQVVAGNLGFEKKMDYTVIGDSVNNVFRLQALTKMTGSGILMGDNTRKLASSHYKVREIDETFNGVKLYELI